MRDKQQDRNGAGEAGVYANYFEIGHNAVEFVLDFGQQYPPESASMHTRIIIPPAYAKALAEMLSEAVDRHERQFGAAIPPRTDKR